MAIKFNPLISIITPVYNAADTIEKCLLSVINQSYNNIEHILIDGASIDGTLDVIQKYRENLKYFTSEADCGIYHAINKGVECCRGNYYLVLGADDFLYKNAIKDVIESNQFNLNYDFIVAGLLCNEKERLTVHPALSFLGAGNMIPGHSVGLWINPKTHEELGFYSYSYPISADAYYIKKLFKYSDNWMHSTVIMGEFSHSGKSNVSGLHGICENFLIQLETESNKSLQILIFILRLFKNIYKIYR